MGLMFGRRVTSHNCSIILIRVPGVERTTLTCINYLQLSQIFRCSIQSSKYAFAMLASHLIAILKLLRLIVFNISVSGSS